MTNAEYFDKLRKEILPRCEARGMVPEDAARYMNGHLPRFEAQLDFFREHLSKTPICGVYDVGTGIPFASYYLRLTDGARVVCGMPTKHPGAIADGVELINWNLCERPPMEPADLVICTECIEHLPCPLPPVAEYLRSLVVPGGYMLLSFPFGKIRASWEKDFGDHERMRQEHLREFDMALAREFLRLIGWQILAERLTYTSAYGGEIWNVLLREAV